MATVPAAGQPSHGPNWLLIGAITLGVVIALIVAVFLLTAGGGDTNASSNNENGDGTQPQVTSVSTNTPTSVPTATPVPPTITPVPPTATPVVPPLTVLIGKLAAVKTTVQTASASYSTVDKQNINQAFTDTETRLVSGDKARIISTIDLLANALYIMETHACQSETDTVTPPAFFEFRGYIYDLADRLLIDGISQSTSKKGFVNVEVLKRMDGCKNPLMKQ